MTPQHVHPSGWNLVEMIDAAEVVCEKHVIPVDDLREHAPSVDCWCQPFEDDEMPHLYAHNSMDRREAIENGLTALN